MLLLPVIELLKTIQTDGAQEFRKVAGAANFAAARDDLKNPPAAYVVPLSDSAKPNALSCGGIEQHVTERFGVVLAVSNLRDTKGEAAQAEFERLRSLVIGALLGFVPGEGYDPVQYGGGRVLQIDASVLWWQLEFVTGYYERKF